MEALPPHLQAEHNLCIQSDKGRKRASMAFVKADVPVPPQYLRSETEEFDRRHGLRNGRRVQRGSSSSAPSSADEGSSAPYSPLMPRHRVLEDGFIAYDPVAFEGGICADDFVSEDILEHFAVVVAKRSVADEREDQKRRRVVEDCNDVLLEQALTASTESAKKAKEWADERAMLERIFVDLEADD